MKGIQTEINLTFNKVFVNKNECLVYEILKLGRVVGDFLDHTMPIGKTAKGYGKLFPKRHSLKSEIQPCYYLLHVILHMLNNFIAINFTVKTANLWQVKEKLIKDYLATYNTIKIQKKPKFIHVCIPANYAGFKRTLLMQIFHTVNQLSFVSCF